MRKMIKPYVRRKPHTNVRNVHVCKHYKDLSYAGAKHLNIRLSKNGDADKDGVKNSKDCKPFDPKRQGWLHDQKMKMLKKQEEHYEAKREKEQKKLEDIKDELRVKNNITQAKLDKKRAQMQEKQARIDEIVREKRKMSEMKEANRKAKEELEKYTVWGKVKRGGAYAGKAAGRGFVSMAKSSAKALKEADRALGSTKARKVRRPRTRVKRKKSVKHHKKRRKKTDDFGW